MNTTRFLVASLLLACASAVPAAAETLVVRDSKLGVKESLDALAKALEAKGIKVLARVDHAAGAKAAGLELPPTEVIMFGNPKLGTPLMAANPTIGIDLPMKVLAWQDKSGKVKIGYVAPKDLVARHGIAGKDEVVAAMTGALDAFSKAAAGE